MLLASELDHTYFEADVGPIKDISTCRSPNTWDDMVQTNQQDKTVSADGHQATGGRGVPQRPHGATKGQDFR
jgi:hypothetical protein